MIRSFRSWFAKRGASKRENAQFYDDDEYGERERRQYTGSDGSAASRSIPSNDSSLRSSPFSSSSSPAPSEDIQAVTRLLFAQIQFARNRDFESFADLHAYKSGFSLYGCFSTAERLENVEALDNERTWFYSIVPNFTIKIRDMHVKVIDSVALATMYADYRNKHGKARKEMTLRGTIVFTREHGTWKILHEHWSTSHGGEPTTMKKFPIDTEKEEGEQEVVPGKLCGGQLSYST